MGKVTSLFVRKVLGIAHESIDKPDVLRSLAIDPDAPVDPALMVTDTDYYGFLENLASLDPCATSLSLRAGAAMRCNDYGAFGLAWKSAATLRGSFLRAERYAQVLTSVSTYEVEPVGGGAFMHLHREGERRLGLRLSNEATLASIVSISREVSGADFAPVEAHFKHAAPSDLGKHEEYFRCRLRFDSDRDALLVSDEALETPNRRGDDGISKFFDAHLEAEIARLEPDDLLERQVREEVTRILSEGVPTVADVARQLGMSGRTLQRRLLERGGSFQDLVDNARRELAHRLLQETNYSLTDIAFMTGFSEQSAFTRAFKRWAGQTPRSYRLGA